MTSGFSKGRIAVMMSGGVDSSVTALLLRDAGWDVLGVTMKLPVLGGDPFRACCGADAPTVCRALGVPHHFLDVEQAFLDSVVEPFRQAYAAGETPSPCVDCNTHFKFGAVWDSIREMFGVKHLATGHYVRITCNGGGHVLRRAVDVSRDQSYFLYGIPRERLPFLHCPLGEKTKSAARDIAAEAGLPVAQKPDSMELCFAGEGDYRGVLTGLRAKPGPVYDPQGKQIGEHQGIHLYTVGQRRGLPASTSGPIYVIQIRPESNAIVAGPRRLGLVNEVRACKLNVLAPGQFKEGARLSGKIRSVGEPTPCSIILLAAGELKVAFDEPVFAPAAGQHLVLYNDSGEVVAGGTIKLQ